LKSSADWLLAAAAILLGAAPGCRSSVVPVEPLPLPALSAAELQRLEGQNAAVVGFAQKAEAAIAAGQLDRAADLYAQARQGNPRHGLPHRRHCEVLTRLGRREPALAACKLALQWGAGVADLRAAVGAIVSADRPLTLDEVADATILATGARRLLPGQPHGYAAFADIARRIGDQEMLRANLAELERWAPGHPETLRARALMPRSFDWLRSAVALALLALLVAAAIRGLQRPSSRAALRASAAG
jgi:hypothetical protein